jgi:hypothetical protein
VARRHRRRRDVPATLGSGAGTRIEQRGGEQWYVRPVTGAAAARAYRCPGCQQTIAPAAPHLVVWPLVPSLLTATAGGTGLDERRHWHQACWTRHLLSTR